MEKDLLIIDFSQNVKYRKLKFYTKLMEHKIDILHKQMKIMQYITILFVIVIFCMLGLFGILFYQFEQNVERTEQKVYELSNRIDTLKTNLDGLSERIDNIETEMINYPVVQKIYPTESEKSIDIKNLLSIDKVISGKATGYDLSIQCCGKPMNSSSYGITKNGTNLKGKTHSEAMAIAVDPKIIPLGSYVYLEFKKESHLKYNGIYKSVDTGSSKVSGNKVDVFVGDFNSETVSEEAQSFSVVECDIYILSSDYGG